MIGEPPVEPGASQVRSRPPPTGFVTFNERGGEGAVAGVALTSLDRSPGPAEFTAATWNQ